MVAHMHMQHLGDNVGHEPRCVEDGDTMHACLTRKQLAHVEEGVVLVDQHVEALLHWAEGGVGSDDVVHRELPKG